MALQSHTLPPPTVHTLLDTLHTTLSNSTSPHVYDAVCAALYGVACMFCEDPDTLTTLHPRCAALAHMLDLQAVSPAPGFSQLLQADFVFTYMGPGPLLPAHALERGRSMGDVVGAPRRVQSMDQLLHQAAHIMQQRAPHVWGSVRFHVRLMANMPPIEAVLTTQEQPPRHVAVVLQGTWDTFVNEPDVLKGSSALQRAMLRTLGYVVVTVDMQDVVDRVEHVDRAMWLQGVLQEALGWQVGEVGERVLS